MAKVECQRKGNILLNDTKTIGFCGNCGEIVSRSQYGCDDECPRCGEWLDWEEE